MKIFSLKGRERQHALKEYARPRGKSYLEKAIVVFDLALGLYLFGKLILLLIARPASWIEGLIVLPLTLFIADFIGQCFHKWLDSFASETNPIYGKAAQEFRKHHEYPSNLNEVSYLSHLSAFGPLMAPFFIVAALVDWSHHPGIGLNVLLLCTISLHATEIHKQAHLLNPPRIIHWLQKLGLLINRKRHLRHHKEPFDSNFAVVNGWTQALTDKTGFWLWCDQFYYKTTGRLPNHWIQAPHTIPQNILDQWISEKRPVNSDLIAYAQVYPERIPPKLKSLIDSFDREQRTNPLQSHFKGS